MDDQAVSIAIEACRILEEREPVRWLDGRLGCIERPSSDKTPFAFTWEALVPDRSVWQSCKLFGPRRLPGPSGGLKAIQTLDHGQERFPACW